MMQMAKLTVGDEVNVEFHEGGTITITPLGETSGPSEEEMDKLIESTMEDYSDTMRKLA